MRIDLSSDRTVPGLAAEFLIIVIGVLVALGVDEWRTNSSEHAREGETLADLLEEFRQNRAVLQDDLQNNVQRVEYFDRWIAFSEQADPEPEEVFSTWQELTSTVVFNPINGVLQGVIDAGELRLISNRDLRALFSGWPTIAGELTYVLQLNLDFTNRWLQDKVRLGPREKRETAMKAREDPAYNNWMREFSWRAHYGINRAETVKQQLDKLIESIEQELASRD